VVLFYARKFCSSLKDAPCDKQIHQKEFFRFSLDNCNVFHMHKVTAHVERRRELNNARAFHAMHDIKIKDY
jgi:hypothetical protein